MSIRFTLTRFIGAFILSGCGLLAGAQQADAPVSVQAVPLGELLIRPEISAPATVESLSDSRIGSELSATIAAIEVRVGDIVAPGDALVRLDCGDYDLRANELRARLASTRARVDFADRQLERARKLQSSRTLSREILDQREAELLSLQAELGAQQALLNQVDRNRSKCSIAAPFRAVVMERLASVGEYAMPGTPLLRILALEQLEVSADIIDSDADSLAIAGTILLRHGGRDYPLALRTLTPVIDPQSRTREARLEFVDETALAGSAGRLVWYQRPSLPADLLVRRQGQLGVLLAENGKARFHVLESAQEGRPTPADLAEDVLVITEGRFGVEDGDAVNYGATAPASTTSSSSSTSEAAAPSPQQPPPAENRQLSAPPSTSPFNDVGS